MTSIPLRPVLRCLAALASVAALAACQHAAPQRAHAGPDAARQASAAPAAPQAQPAAGSAAPVVTFHLAQVRPAQGLARVQLNPGTSLYAVPQPVFTQADLQQVVPVQDSKGQVYLRFEFNPRGAAKLAQISREAVGNYLIVSVRGRPVAVPQISAAYEDGKLPVAVDSAEDAQAIVQRMRQPAG
ncbi:hypothetical protein GG851_26950 [Bordetella petrii]|nr:hypothetical protein [Bordetella petrii]